CFSGFYTGFLESNPKAVADRCYMLRFMARQLLAIAVFIRWVQASSGKHNQSTRDGTKVVVQAEKCQKTIRQQTNTASQAKIKGQPPRVTLVVRRKPRCLHTKPGN